MPISIRQTGYGSMSEKPMDILNAVRALAQGKQPAADISDILYEHGCFYLLSMLKAENRYTKAAQTQAVLNRISVRERYAVCRPLFQAFDDAGIPYAVVKGAVLSQAVYGDCGLRASGDIDLLMDRRDIDEVEAVLAGNGFIQGRVTDEGVVPFTRKELLFQTALSHQTAPFIKRTTNPLCPYVNVDINLAILWGESRVKGDMGLVLSATEPAEICGAPLRKLSCEMELIALCLHHYKDANSLFLLMQNGLRLSLFCDIYFYMKRCRPDLHVLGTLCRQLQVTAYVYYCLYYANRVFDDDALLSPYLSTLETERAIGLLDTYGLEEAERKKWDMDFEERLFHPDFAGYFRTCLTPSDINKIQANSRFM